ncbi:MAG: Ig-like domain-containing protein [Candidatus Zixiibacteriota bacterium]
MSLLRNSSRVPVVLLGIFLLALLTITGCETTKEPTSSGGGGTTTGDVNLSQPTATPSAFDQGSTTIVTITATDADSELLPGVQVTFAVTPVSAGTFNPTTATTDAYGVASTIFTAAQSGTFQITGTDGTTTSAYVNINVNSSAQQTSGNLSMNITPSLLTADGSSNATVIVHVSDEESNPAPDSTIVKLTCGERFDDVDGNGYYSTGDSLMFDFNANDTWDPIGVIPSVAYTQAGSIAVAYTAGSEATTSYIKATVTGTTDFDGSVEASIQLTPDATIYAIELSTDVTGIQVRHTGGLEFTDLKAICYDVAGNRVPEGVTVNFSISNGPGGGENINGQGAGPVTAITNSNGIATVQVWAGTISGTLRLYASAGSVLSNAAFVSVFAGPPYYIAVGSDFCNMDGWNTVNRELYVDAVVSDIYHNPVQDSVVVYFTVDEGVIDAYGITQDSSGVAQAIFRTGEPQVDGRVWVWGETSGGTVVGSTMFINSYIPSSITATMSPQMLSANGESEATFWADVRDLNNNFVIDETEVTTKTLYGTANGGGTSDGCNASIFEGSYMSPVLKQDYSMTGGNDDGIGGIDVITIRSGFASTYVVCTLTTGTSFYDESGVSLDASSVPYGATGIPIRAVIKDRAGNPLGDHTLTATISSGTMTTATSETNTYGEAYDFRFSAPADSTGGTKGLITITDTDPRGGNLVMTTTVTFSNE